MTASRRFRHGAALALLLVGSGCTDEADPRDQWRIAIGTDAPVPQFVDRVLVEVLAEDGAVACTGCRRQFGIAGPQDLPLSFGVATPTSAGTYRVRVRLYRGQEVDAFGIPTGVGLIDRTGELPVASGITDVTLSMAMACFGVASDLDARETCDPNTGELADEPMLTDGDLPEPGSWAPAEAVPCEGAIDDGMVCLEGGALLLGASHVLGAEATIPLPEQVVQVGAFALDEDELTVGAFRKLRLDGKVVGLPRLHDPDFASPDWGCTYRGDTVAGADDLPLTCVPRVLAEQACDALGKRLPTEAEWEFAAGNRDRETRFPWGNSDASLCTRSIVGRGRTPVELVVGGVPQTLVPESPVCRGLDDVVGPQPGGAALDVTEAGIRNLGGNVAEWVADDFSSYADPECWAHGASLVIDPQCESGIGESFRGGAWSKLPATTNVSSRYAADPGADLAAVGFRCAKSR